MLPLEVGFYKAYDRSFVKSNIYIIILTNSELWLLVVNSVIEKFDNQIFRNGQDWKRSITLAVRLL